MKKRKDTIEKRLYIFKNDLIKISEDPSNELFFEIKTEMTNDIAEAVSIMMKMNIKDIWNIEINSDKININPEKSLYWLTGGDREWITLEHYKYSWVNCYSSFEEEFGDIIYQIVDNSKKIGDIKEGFIKYLNLPILYDFAIGKGFIK